LLATLAWLRLPALGPMLDMVGIQIALIGAAGETASRIADVERAADRRRDAAGLAPHIERFAPLGLDDANQARIAAQTAHRLGRQRGAVLEVAASGGLILQRLCIDVHHHLEAIRGAPGRRGLGRATRVLQIPFGHPGQRIGAPTGIADRLLLGKLHIQLRRRHRLVSKTRGKFTT